ncbi:hypothetical protein D9M68_816200 [compost metagenome]
MSMFGNVLAGGVAQTENVVVLQTVVSVTVMPSCALEEKHTRQNNTSKCRCFAIPL